MLFGASLIGYVLTRVANPDWRAGMPGLPPGVFGTTVVIALLSAAMHGGLSAIRQNKPRALERALIAAFVLALGFLVVQAFNWNTMATAELATRRETLYPFTFFLLTGVHALHVVGGLPVHAFVLYRASRREYSSSRHEGVRLTTQYWDFLGVVWVVLLTTLYAFT